MSNSKTSETSEKDQPKRVQQGDIQLIPEKPGSVLWISDFGAEESSFTVPNQREYVSRYTRMMYLNFMNRSILERGPFPNPKRLGDMGGGRGAPRSGFRGRGGGRGAPRGGFRGRGDSRGGFRGGFRGGDQSVERGHIRGRSRWRGRGGRKNEKPWDRYELSSDCISHNKKMSCDIMGPISPADLVISIYETNRGNLYHRGTHQQFFHAGLSLFDRTDWFPYKCAFRLSVRQFIHTRRLCGWILTITQIPIKEIGLMIAQWNENRLDLDFRRHALENVAVTNNHPINIMDLMDTAMNMDSDADSTDEPP